MAYMPGKMLFKDYLNCSLLHPNFHFSMENYIPVVYKFNNFIILTVFILSCQAGSEETKCKGWWVR